MHLWSVRVPREAINALASKLRMTTLVETFAAFAAGTRFEDLPVEVVEESKRLLLDSIGCALAGVSHPKGTIAIEYARQQGPGARGAQASIIGTSERFGFSVIAELDRA